MAAEFFDVPALKYYGSKWQMAEFIISQMPPHDAYIEPYCGSAAVFLRKWPVQLEVLNDSYRDLINFFDVLRTRTEELVRAIDLTPFSYEEYLRSVERTDNPLEAARRFYVRSWQSFESGGGRSSTWRRMKKPGRGSSPAHDWKRLSGLWQTAYRLKDAQIDCLDALTCIRRYDHPKALFYVDPPYPIESRKRRDRRYKHDLVEADHRTLSVLLHQVKGMVLISGYDCALYRELYADWHFTTKTTTTNGNSTATEYLWISPSAADVKKWPLFAWGGVDV